MGIIVCTVYLELRWDLLWNFSNMILIDLMWTRIPSGPDNYKRVIEYQTIDFILWLL